MEDRSGACPGPEEPVVETQPNNNRPQWSNGQCVFAVLSTSAFNPTFDLSACRARLETHGFQIPVSDMEEPLRTALEASSVRRYMVFNSAFFHFLMAPVLYLVLWCALFSTVHVYITVSDYWILCLCVSLVAVFLTTAIIFTLHCSNNEINMNLDVRLIQVNERLVKHKLLVAASDWVHNCTGKMQLFFVYWELGRCLRALTEALEESSFVENQVERKLKKKMSSLVLVSTVKAEDPEVAPDDPEVGASDPEQQDSDERRPLLGDNAPTKQKVASKLTVTHSLIPDAALPAQAKAYQLLMTYSAAYVKLLVSKRLSGPSHYRLRSRRNHCTFAPLCLCQYIKKKILQ